MKKDQNSVSLLIKQKPKNDLLAGQQGVCFQMESNNHLFKISIYQKDIS